MRTRFRHFKHKRHRLSGYLPALAFVAAFGMLAGSRISSDTPKECGFKRYCGQMTDCAEATHYFRGCGVTRLDGDGDGVPCESLCR